MQEQNEWPAYAALAHAINSLCDTMLLSRKDLFILLYVKSDHGQSGEPILNHNKMTVYKHEKITFHKQKVEGVKVACKTQKWG